MPIADSCNLAESVKILYPDLVNLYGCTIGEGVFVGHGVMFINDRHPKANNEDWVLETTVLEDDVGIGSGAVVTHDVPPGAAVVGVSARQTTR